ncbi:MAG TPA: hypothetical protein VM577_18400 [Anaerovoracaceae bacterium]|nr:hypothetical protein [Anaerovoracaceae bacterium]
MSADSWVRCPRCLKNALDNIQAPDYGALSRAYGNVSESEYRALLDGQLKDRDRYIKDLNRAHNLAETMREDYELGMDSEGEFTVAYSCHCTECDWSWKFNYKVQTPVG